MEKSQKLLKEDDVLNGIAFDEKNNRIFVTGKKLEKTIRNRTYKKTIINSYYSYTFIKI